jgi:hypothetical protein
VLNGAGFSGAGLPTIDIHSTIRSLTVIGGSATDKFEVDALPFVPTVSLFTNDSDQVFGAAAGRVNRQSKINYIPIILH